MNSKNLKQKYHDEYKKFFTEHNIVLSMPLLINWARDIRNFNGVSIKQKIPLRIYGGIKLNNSQKITLNKVTRQNIYTNEVEDHITTKELIDYTPYIQDIENYLNEHHIELIKKYGGIEINIFSEVNRGIGGGYDSIFAMLISSLIHRLKGRLTNEKYIEINELKIDDALNANKLYKEILEEAKNMSVVMFGYGFSGDKITSFFSGHYPTVTNTKLLKRIGDKKIHKYRGYRLNELFTELPERPYTPIDFGLIFSGQPTFIEQILGTYTNNSGGFSSIKEELKKDIKGKFTYTNEEDKPDFFSLLENEDETYYAYGSVMGTLSLKILHFMHKAYKKSYDETEMKYLFQSLKRIRTYQTISRPFSKRYQGFINKLWDNFNGDTSRLTLFPNDTGTVGGCICFTTPLQVYRKHIKNMIKTTKYEGRKLVYSNGNDGIESNGLIFEQDIDNNIFSEFIEPNNYILKKIDGSNELGDHETLIKKSDKGLLLDTIGNKIYLNGTKLTSKDIPSQTTTIETLGFLIHNIGKEISNKELPNSSYSKNKNEMLGKIVLPIIKLLETKLKRKLPLICKGSIYDFYIKLEKTEIPIYIIQSI